jgi:hypothetical protein
MSEKAQCQSPRPPGSEVILHSTVFGRRSLIGTEPALLNLKQCCADVTAFEIRILASSIEKQLVLDGFMQI